MMVVVARDAGHRVVRHQRPLADASVGGGVSTGALVMSGGAMFVRVHAPDSTPGIALGLQIGVSYICGRWQRGSSCRFEYT
jgi:hypothetical protein